MLLCLFTAFALSLELAPPKPIFVIGRPAESNSDKPDHVLFSPDGKRLYSTGQVGFIEASDTLTGKSLLSIRTGEKWLGAIALNPQGTRLASSHGDRVKVWDTATANEVLRFTAWPGNSVPCLAFDRTGTRVACPTAPDKVTVWELSTGRPVATFQRELKTDNTRDCICNLAYSPDGNSLAAADTATEYVTVWSTISGKVRFTLPVKDSELVWDLGIANCKGAIFPGWAADCYCGGRI
jgi:WD40 repeat protein